MRIKTRLFIISGILFIITGAAIVALVNYSMKQQALVEAEEKIKLMSNQYLAIHTYFSKKLKPALFAFTEPLLSKEYFDPVWMSSTYALREIHDYTKAHGNNEYYIKDAAINARTPENEATPFEREFIAALNKNPRLETSKVIQVIEGKPHLVVLHRGELTEEDCLRCHSSPEQAPEELVSRYGPESGFNRKAGETVSAISIRVPLASAYAGADRFSIKLSIIILTLFSIFLGAFFGLINRLILTPLARINKKAHEISNSKEQRLGEVIELPQGRELRELTVNFNKMSIVLREQFDNIEKIVQERTSELVEVNEQLSLDITERKRAEEALRENENRYRSLFSEAIDGICLADAKTGVIIDCNQALATLVERGRMELIGQQQTILHPPASDKKGFSPSFEQHLTNKQGKILETQVVTKTGEIREVEIKANSLHLAKGKVLQGIFNDVTERKRAEDQIRRSLREKEVMLKEIHHRVKNNLQVILSLLNLQADEADNDVIRAMFEESRSRINSMALIHEKLYRSQDLAHIDFKEYLQDLINEIAITFNQPGVSFSIDMDSVPVDVNTGIPLALITNELISNCLKHAFPDKRKGTILVGLKKTGDKDYVFTVADNGVGFPASVDFRDTASLGLRLVNALTRQLDGTIELSTTGGTKFCISFSETSAEERGKNEK